MGADGGVAATRLQAAHRGRAGRDKAEAERARRTAILANGPQILDRATAYQPQPLGAPDKPKPRPRTAHK